jgi:exopolysaccharide biosynthesis polyprenyl glycosylphosphotransferase
VVFALPFSRLLDCEEQISWCEETGTTVHLKVDFVRTLLSRTYPSELDGTPMLTISSTPRDPVSLAVKRSLDIVVSTAALACLAPLMLACAGLVKATSRGPVLFRQDRVGQSGRIFTLLKFRSMYADAEARKKELEGLNEMSGPVFKMKNDPRVTPVGRWLRKFSLDELPQLWNVLVGDLSLVGPRPPTPDEVVRYERWQRRRLSVKPGVTCLWQVSGRNAIDFADWMKLDLTYIDNWSLKLDLKILLRTIPAVLFARGSR